MIAHAEDAPARILIGGRAYRPVKIEDVTLQHDVFVMSRMARSGFGDVPLGPAETPDEYATRALGLFLASPVVLELVAGLVVPWDMPIEDWTEDLARETAHQFAKLTDPADKAAVHSLILAALIPFLESGLVSLSRIVTSSAAPRNETNEAISESANASVPGAISSAP